MIIESTEKRDVSPKQLAKALAHGSAKDFADFWLYFNGICDDESIDIDKFAEAMYPSLGGARKVPLRRIFQYMEYLEVKNDRDNE